MDFKLVLKDDTLQSPEVDAWLRNVETIMKKEMIGATVEVTYAGNDIEWIERVPLWKRLLNKVRRKCNEDI